MSRLETVLGGDAEGWRTIPGSEGLYSVSNLGRIRSEPQQTSHKGRRRGRILKPYRDSKGYMQFRMCLTAGRNVGMKVHRAVALAFIGPRPAGAQINHKSGNKLDNSFDNLEYVSCRENIRHGWAIGLYAPNHRRGEASSNSKLTNANVHEIRTLRASTRVADLAARFGVTQSTISQICKGRTWKHVA